jgi:hypothetical protein
MRKSIDGFAAIVQEQFALGRFPRPCSCSATAGGIELISDNKVLYSEWRKAAFLR